MSHILPNIWGQLVYVLSIYPESHWKTDTQLKRNYHNFFNKCVLHQDSLLFELLLGCFGYQNGNLKVTYQWSGWLHISKWTLLLLSCAILVCVGLQYNVFFYIPQCMNGHQVCHSGWFIAKLPYGFPSFRGFKDIKRLNLENGMDLGWSESSQFKSFVNLNLNFIKLDFKLELHCWIYVNMVTGSTQPKMEKEKRHTDPVEIGSGPIRMGPYPDTCVYNNM